MAKRVNNKNNGCYRIINGMSAGALSQFDYVVSYGRMPGGAGGNVDDDIWSGSGESWESRVGTGASHTVVSRKYI